MSTTPPEFVRVANETKFARLITSANTDLLDSLGGTPEQGEALTESAFRTTLEAIDVAATPEDEVIGWGLFKVIKELKKEKEA